MTLFLSKIPPERLSFTTLGYNIYQTDLDLEFLVQYINKYKLRPHLRFGLAHPIQGGKNTYIPASELGIMAKKLVAYRGLFEQNNVAPEFDCRMPMCIFSEEELGKLRKANKGVLKFGCGPAIDIGPDMKVWGPIFRCRDFIKNPFMSSILCRRFTNTLRISILKSKQR